MIQQIFPAHYSGDKIVGGEWTELHQILGEHRTIIDGPNVLDFRYIAVFGNQSTPKATAVENRGQISDVSSTVQVREMIGKMSKWINQKKFNYKIQPVIYFDILRRF